MSRYDYDEFDDYDFYDYDFDDYEPRKKGGIKTAFIITLIILLCISVAGAFLHATGLTDRVVSIGGVIDGSDDEFDGEVDTPTGENESLKEPSNLSSLTASGMQMVSGASIYVGGGEGVGPSIRFTCLLENSLVEELDGNDTKKAGILMAPLDYFDAVNEENYTCIDWVSAFEKAGKTYMLSLFDGFGKYDDDTSYARLNLTNVLYQNINRKFVGIGVIITGDGENASYKYSSYSTGNYRTSARSVAYVAGAALNANKLGMESFTEEEIATLKSYINMSVDQANGLEKATNDNSTYELKVLCGSPKTLAVGESFTVETEMTPSVEVPIWYRSSDTDILTVDDTGKVTAVGKGIAKVRILLAGVEHTITVTVN